MVTKASVYWIHSKEHNNPFKEGYVGVSKNVQRRIQEHKSKKENPILENVFKKYDKKYENILVDILFEGDYQHCFEIEKEYRPVENIGWNINCGGSKPPDITGIKRSEQTKKLISENNVGFKGRKHSEETKKRMSESRRKNGGRPHTEETKIKLSQIAKQRLNTHTNKEIN